MWKTTNNKIYIASADMYFKIFANSNWLEILTLYKTTRLETLGKTLVWSNNWIKSYAW